MDSVRTIRRLPGVLVLLLVAGALLSVPMALTTRATLDEMAHRLESADEVQDGVAGVRLHIEAAASLAAEASATSAVSVADALPASIAAMISTDFADALANARASVDGAFAAMDATELTPMLDAARNDIDSGEMEHNDAVALLLDIGDEVGRDLVGEFAMLSEAVGGMHGGDQVARDADVARVFAELSVRASAASALWGGIVSPTDPPTLAEIERFVGSVGLWRTASDTADVLVEDGSAMDDEWYALRTSASHTTVEAVYADTIASFADGRPVDPPPRGDDVEITPELLAELQIVNGVVEALAEDLIGSYELAESAADVVDASNADLQSAATSERTRAIVVLAMFILVAFVAAIWLGVLVIRPLRRISQVASGLSRGDLTGRAQVSGPAELRTTAVALNEALDALERAEAKANALADGRPFGQSSTESIPGPLASSLDAAVARLAAVMAEREQLRRQLAHEAGHDGLTGLFSRNSVIAQLDDLLADRSPGGAGVALMYVDIDDFKGVNDQYGHHVGDELLRSIADRLRHGTELGDIGGRLGGDEIVVVSRDVLDETDAVARAERLRVALGEPLTISGVTLVPSVSVGVAVARRSDITAEALIQEADLALYRAKELGRGRVELCDDSVREIARVRSELDRCIDRALVDDEFALHYQPIVDVGSGHISGVEALVRWHRDGSISPSDDFIPHAERSERIVAIDRWVLGAAVAQAAEWTGIPGLGDLPIAVNLSGNSLADPRLAGDVLDLLHGAGVEPWRLVVEVTERSVLDDVATIAAQLAQLRSMGVRVALDDFGTGHMSLATLRRFDIDVIKIDRSFVSRLAEATDCSLVDLMVRTGQLLDVEVIAEGVETVGEYEMLADMGVTAIQGYLLGRPVPAEQLAGAVAATRDGGGVWLKVEQSGV